MCKASLIFRWKDVEAVSRIEKSRKHTAKLGEDNVNKRGCHNIGAMFSHLRQYIFYFSRFFRSGHDLF